MFSLLSGLWNYLFSVHSLHILILGLDHAGKTTFLEKIKAIYRNRRSTGPGSAVLSPEQIRPTIGMNLAKLTLHGLSLIFWDLGGQIKMRSLWEKYYDEADCIIFVVDSSDIERLEEAKQAFDVACDNEVLSNVPILLVANKQDVVGSLCANEIRDHFLNSVTASKRRSCSEVLGVCSLSGEGIEIAVETVTKLAKQHALNHS